MSLAVVFDLDDTLYLERHYVRSGFLAAADWLQQSKGLDGFAPVAWRLFEQGVRGDTFNRALAELGVTADEDLVAGAVAAYRGHMPKIELLPDARAAIARCKAGGVPMGLLSDGYLAVQERKVEALGLAKLLDAIVLSDALGRDAWKPAEQPYRAVERALGLLEARFIYVGDNPLKDFVTARRLGWRTVRVRRPGGEHQNTPAPATHEADVTVSSLDDLNWESYLPARDSQ
jgi:putative hydrolase of the HAD superfamily